MTDGQGRTVDFCNIDYRTEDAQARHSSQECLACAFSSSIRATLYDLNRL